MKAKLFEIASEIRAKCLKFAMSDDSNGYDFHGEKDLDMMCATASLVLCKRLSEVGVNNFVIDGYYKGDKTLNHCWVEACGFIIDITATQFKGPDVFVDNASSCRKVYPESYELSKKIDEWPEEQIPSPEVIDRILAIN